MRRVLLHIAAFCLVLAALPSGQSPEAGRVVGRVRLTTRLPGHPLPSTAYPRRTVDSRDAPALPQIRNVVVFIKDAAPDCEGGTARVGVLGKDIGITWAEAREMARALWTAADAAEARS